MRPIHDNTATLPACPTHAAAAAPHALHVDISTVASHALTIDAAVAIKKLVQCTECKNHLFCNIKTRVLKCESC